MSISGVIFDLGGTLFEFNGEPEQVYHDSRLRLLEVLAEGGIDLPRQQAADAVRREVEASHLARMKDDRERRAQDVIRRALAAIAQRTIPEELLDRAVRAMFEVSEACWQVLPGAEATLKKLRTDGMRLGVISNASDADNVRRLLDKGKLARYFDPIVVSADIGWRKPAAAVFEPLLEAWQLPVEQLAMVGDTLNADIVGAQRLGIHGLWLKTAPDRPDNQAARQHVNPSMEINSLAEVPRVIGQLVAAGSTSGGLGGQGSA